MNRKHSPINTQGRQSGAAMVIALVMLLVLTLLATASARMTLLEERMTGNTQDRNVAFQVAEAALRQGEDIVQQPVLPEFNNDDGLYQPAAPADDPVWRTVDWNDTDNDVIAFDGLDDAPGALANASATLIVEEMPSVPTPGSSMLPLPVDEPAVFRVTARALGVDGTSVVTLQTTYRR